VEKTDLRKQFEHLYSPSAREAEIVRVPALKFAMVDGRGDPNGSPAFQDAVQALYGVSYTLKFSMKMAGVADWTVLPLEGLWWADGDAEFHLERKDDWCWTLLIAQPGFVKKKDVTAAIGHVARKKPSAALEQLRLERFAEGLSAQILHVGPYAEEAPTIARLEAFAHQNGYRFSGRHHEIYMSDPRRCAPDRLKTVIRHPVKKAK